MDPIEALKTLRAFINIASQTNDIDAIYRVLREMRGVVNNALPPVRKKKAGKRQPKKAALRVIK